MINRIIRKGNPDKPHIAFTFDDGPYRRPLDDWLDPLEKWGGRGTFFFTGEWLDKHTELAREIIYRGHEIAPHTYHHRRIGEISKEVFWEEMQMAELAYQEATGLACPTFFRSPYNHYRDENLEWFKELGYYNIRGDISDDWSGISSKQIINNVQPALQNGTIVVFHANDIAKGTPGAIDPLLEFAYQKKLVSVRVSDILKDINIRFSHRFWKVSIDVPTTEIDDTLMDWQPIENDEALRQLATQTMDWGIPHIPKGDKSKEHWLQYLSQPISINEVKEDRKLFVGWRMIDHYWGYVRAGVHGDELLLMDFATREAQADALIYLLRWAAKTAKELGCSKISTTKDLRRLHKMAQQLGWKSSIELDDSLIST
ncbi:polysaccharide deacetylase family protein [Pseudogracilibacillus auburnensis]|uniref:polysaccharide deacetylase family protein n=1 Tax=Pseudogracilibacillus auburnensis TaxID=1494959 RepID=UPI001A967BE0|nr:polysaccharide deacetylase family protein [Pseudogracilibacillus auburnensis]MBO1004811.1 polysaccharide deacetylase family protein [Pseudogracilibacillus auburnensis]